MADFGVANQGEAEKCLRIARDALAAERLDKAAKFAEKAMRLYPNDEARPGLLCLFWRCSLGLIVSTDNAEAGSVPRV